MGERPILTQMPKVGHSLDRRTARDVIAEKLMVLIATNMLRPGDELPGERELAQVLHVSRETVRGAVQSGGGGGGGTVTLENLEPLDGFIGSGMDTIDARVWTTNFAPATGVVAWAEFNIHSGEWELYASDCAPPEEESD